MKNSRIIIILCLMIVLVGIGIYLVTDSVDSITDTSEQDATSLEIDDAFAREAKPQPVVTKKKIMDMGNVNDEWEFELRKLDELNVTIEHLYNRTYRAYLTSINSTKTSRPDYRWKMGMNYTNTTAITVSESVSVEELNALTTDRARIVEKPYENKRANELNQWYEFTIPEDLSEVQLTFGESSTEIWGTSPDSTSLSWGNQDKGCVAEDGQYWVVFTDSGDDLWVANSSDGGDNWDSTEIHTTNSEKATMLCGTNDELIIVYQTTSGDDTLRWLKSTDNGLTWDSSTLIDGGTFEDVGDSSAAIDSNGDWHVCYDISSRIYYSNETRGAASSLSSNDADFCDIEVDYDDNVYMVIKEDDTTDDWWMASSRDGWGSVKKIYDTFSSQTESHHRTVSLTISHDGTLMVTGNRNSRIYYCKAGRDAWDSGTGAWTCAPVKDASSFTSDAGYDGNGTYYVIWQNQGGHGTATEMFRQTSYDNGTTWSQELTHTNCCGNGHILQSTYPVQNNMNGTLRYIYQDASDGNDLYYDEVNYYNVTGGGGPTDSCEYGGSGDWIVECDDNCNITTDVTAISGDLYLSGDSGTFSVDALINFTGTGRNIYINTSSCEMHVYPGGSINDP